MNQCERAKSQYFNFPIWLLAHRYYQAQNNAQLWPTINQKATRHRITHLTGPEKSTCYKGELCISQTLCYEIWIAHRMIQTKALVTIDQMGGEISHWNVTLTLQWHDIISGLFMNNIIYLLIDWMHHCCYYLCFVYVVQAKYSVFTVQLFGKLENAILEI